MVVRTLDEVRAGRVTIEIHADQVDMVRVVEQPLVQGRAPGYWADACEKAEREVRELREARAGDAGTIEALREQVADLGQQLLTSQQAREIETRRAQEYDKDRHTERDRADKAEHDLADLKRRTDEFLNEANVRERRQAEEIGRRFTVAQVEDAKAGARADERARLDREVIKPLNEKLSQIHSAVLGTELARQIAEHRRDDTAMFMVEALAEVRRITGVTSV